MTGVAGTVGGGLLPFAGYVLGWVQLGGLLWLVVCAMFASFGLLLVWNLSRYAQEGYWFDRKYKLVSVRWSYSPNKDLETLRAVVVGERQLVCLSGTIPHITIAVSPAENLTPFDPEDDIKVTLLSPSLRNGGTVSVRQPHRQAGSTFSFRVDFNPPLYEGEEVTFKYTFTLPRFKTSTIESLRSRCQNGKLDARDYEYASWSVLYPIDRLIFDHKFSPECRITPLGIEVQRGEATPFDEENKNLIKSRSFRCEQLDNGWRMLLDRVKPQMKTRYRIKWRPPTKSNLAEAFAMESEH